MAITSIKTGSSFTNLVKYNDFLAGNPAFSPSSYESIATAVGTGSSGTISFTSIPGTYKHLQIRYIGKSTDTAAATVYNYTVKYNGSSASYSYHASSANGSTSVSTGTASTTAISTTTASIPNSAASLANMVAAGILDISDYTSTSYYKTLRGWTGSNTNNTIVTPIVLFSGLWYATAAAITQIDLTLATGSWTTTSTFALYGIKGA